MSDTAVAAGPEYDVLTTSAPIDNRTRVLKRDDVFGVFDRFGDIEPFGPTQLGVYRGDTRFLSRLRLRLEGERPLMLDSRVSEDNTLFTVELTNVDVRRGEEVAIPHGTLHLLRSKVIWGGACHEKLVVTNYALVPVEFSFSVEFGADFADIFEVRGHVREAHGTQLAPDAEWGRLVLGYEGLDGRRRTTRVSLDPGPEWRGAGRASYHVHLESHAETTFVWSIRCELDHDQSRDGATTPEHYMDAAREAQAASRGVAASRPLIRTSNDQFNDWLNRSFADIDMLTTHTSHGAYPYAGVPWFSTPFGRDGIITALECLWVNPELARGVLGFLADTQSAEDDPERDSQPGKIVHETRDGEMAALREVPFARYYGSIDATPLFVMLAGAYHLRTGDDGFLHSLWPAIDRALGWIDREGDLDGDGFYEYQRRSATGLLNQGWKDSNDTVFHSDGTLAEGPIALVEVQGYVYAAKVAAARLAGVLGLADRATALRLEAEALRERFEEAFWCEEVGAYALALDGDKRPCCVLSSNAGHSLFSGIAGEERAHLLAQTLSRDTMFSGWGIRTLASAEARYNPMSYHNGSVWPHDNALIAAGFGRYGLKGAALNVMSGLFDASMSFESHRLPELFCGFRRRAEEGPTLYPVACSPQAWAAGAVFLCLQSCLGIEVAAAGSKVTFSGPVLPPSLDWVEIRRLPVGEAMVDLVLTRRLDQAVVGVENRVGDIRVVTLM